MATTSFDLSNEILVEILKYLGTSPKSISALSMTCRRLLPIARNVLYRDIEVFGPSSPANAQWPRLVHLLRSWENNPILLAQTLKTFTFDVSVASSDPSGRIRLGIVLEYQDSLAWLLKALASAKQLRNLTLHSANTNHIRTLILAFRNSARISFPVLERLAIKNPGCIRPADSLSLVLCGHPPLREIQIDSAVGIDPKCAYLPATLPAKKTAIRSFVMTRSLVSDDALKLILSSTSALERLKICVPDYHQSYFDQYGQVNPFTTLQPSRLDHKCFAYGLVPRLFTDGPVDLFVFGRAHGLQRFLLEECVVYEQDIRYRRAIPPSTEPEEAFISFDTSQGIFHSNKDLIGINAQGFFPLTEPPIFLDWPRLWSEGPRRPSVMINSFSWLHDLSDKCKSLEQFELKETHKESMLVSPGWLMSVDVVPYHTAFFAEFPFECKISIYIDPKWWRFVKRCRCWNLVDKNPKMLPWIQLQDL